MGLIYKITNIQNNKVYIGQTIRSIDERWKQHIRDARNKNEVNNHFHNAINKYGADNFIINIIEECDNNILDEREKYWISYYDSYNNGYNGTIGGSGRGSNISDEEIFKLWDKGYNCTEIARQLNTSTTPIVSRLQNYNNYSIEEMHQRAIQAASNVKYKPVYQWDNIGTLIATYPSGVEAEQQTGFDHKGISQAINNKCRIYGYYWTHGEVPEYPHRIAQYDLNNNFIKYWKDSADIIKALNKKDQSGILKCCNGKQKTAYGFIWKRE